jgi:hypothetical protein
MLMQRDGFVWDEDLGNPIVLVPPGPTSPARHRNATARLTLSMK